MIALSCVCGFFQRLRASCKNLACKVDEHSLCLCWDPIWAVFQLFQCLVQQTIGKFLQQVRVVLFILPLGTNSSPVMMHLRLARCLGAQSPTISSNYGVVMQLMHDVQPVSTFDCSKWLLTVSSDDRQERNT